MSQCPEKASKSDKVPNAKDGDDSVYRARIKCEGKYFCFNELGQMQTGLQYVGGYIYYFDGNGNMKTGKVSDIEEEDNDLYNYSFITKSGGNGRGVNGEKDGYLYWNGKRLEADDDYRFYMVNGRVYLVNNKGKIQKSTKKYDLESWGAEDIYVEINRSSYAVTKIAVDGNGYLSSDKDDLKNGILTDALVYTLIKEENISIPSIAIYDNVFAPFDPLEGSYNGYFYENDDAVKTEVDRLLGILE